MDRAAMLMTTASAGLLCGWLVFGTPSGARSRATPAVGSVQTLIACPIYRDTDQGRKSGCWLVDDERSAVRYDVTWAPIKPQLGQEILVEGVVTAAPDTCGGVVLKPVAVAVLPGRCEPLKLPAGGYPGRPSPPPAAVLQPSSEPRQLPPPPYRKRSFHIYFEFGRDFLVYQHAEVVLEQVSLYVRASKARRVRVDGFAATRPIRASGRRLAEPPALARARAEMAAEALRRLGVPDGSLELTTSTAPTPIAAAEGRLAEPSKRRVTITVVPP